MTTPRAKGTPELKDGDYVVATKWSNGDPGDQYAIGFFAGMLGDRYLVRDADGKLFRANGFRRIKKISHARGVWLVKHMPEIDGNYRSVWYWVRKSMKKYP